MSEEYLPLDIPLLRSEEQATQETVAELIAARLADAPASTATCDAWITQTLQGSPEIRWGRTRGIAIFARRALEIAGVIGTPEWEAYQEWMATPRTGVSWEEQLGYELSCDLISTIDELNPDDPGPWRNYAYGHASPTNVEGTLRGLLHTASEAVLAEAAGHLEARKAQGTPAGN